MNDPSKYQSEFLEFREELKSFIFRLVTHREETEDLAQETYVRTFKNLNAFQKKSSFKAWVFTIAANLAKDSLRARKRWG